MHKICSIIMLTNKLFSSCYLIFIYTLFNANLFRQYFSKISALHWHTCIDISFCLSLLCFCAHQACLHIPVLLWSLIVNLQENYRMGGSFVWPTVAKVAEYRKKVRKAILDVIDNTPLELPVTQESKWVRRTKTHMTEQWTLNHCWEIWRFAENSWQLARL